MDETLDLANRDPNSLNSHLQTIFEDAFGEPDSIHSIDCVWKNAFTCFTCGKNTIYKILTTLCGLCISLYWGCMFGCVAFQHIWCLTPQCKIYELNCGICQKLHNSIVSTFMDPCCHSCGHCLSHIEVVQKS